MNGRRWPTMWDRIADRLIPASAFRRPGFVRERCCCGGWWSSLHRAQNHAPNCLPAEDDTRLSPV